MSVLDSCHQNLGSLVVIKDQRDPTNVFDHARSILTAWVPSGTNDDVRIR